MPLIFYWHEQVKMSLGTDTVFGVRILRGNMKEKHVANAVYLSANIAKNFRE